MKSMSVVVVESRRYRLIWDVPNLYAGKYNNKNQVYEICINSKYEIH